MVFYVSLSSLDHRAEGRQGWMKSAGINGGQKNCCFFEIEEDQLVRKRKVLIDSKRVLQNLSLKRKEFWALGTKLFRNYEELDLDQVPDLFMRSEILYFVLQSIQQTIGCRHSRGGVSASHSVAWLQFARFLIFLRVVEINQERCSAHRYESANSALKWLISWRAHLALPSGYIFHCWKRLIKIVRGTTF